MSLSSRDVLDTAARQHVPDDINLFPVIAARLERKSFMQTLRARPVFAILVVLLALGLLSGVVYAVGRAFGYIPGMGIVEQDTALRVLAEPVVLERDGITLTVTQALASSDKTIINFQVDNIPESVLAPDFMEGQTPTPICAPNDHLRLPDGTILAPTGGQGKSWKLGFEYRETFDPLPIDVNEVTLLIPCLHETIPGLAPENWEIPLTFIQAPLELTVVPVIELTPSPVPATDSGVKATSGPAPSPITIERTIELDDGYILIGSFHAITTAEGLVTSPYVWYVRITDASGQEVSYDYASDIDLPTGDEYTASWAYQIPGKAYAWPLTLTIDTLDATLHNLQTSFEFNTGLNPQPGQQWILDQDLQINGYTVRVLTATRTPDGYAFSFQADPPVTGVSVELHGPGPYVPPMGGGGGGGGDGSLSASVAFGDQIPEGELTVVLSSVTISIPGPWSIKWEPENADDLSTQTPSVGQSACVTDEMWTQLRGSTPTQMPPGLPGRFILFGPNEDASLYGIHVLDLSDNSRRFLVEGSWPIVSPDGKKIVYTGDSGLAVYDLVSDETLNLSGTNPSDYRMVWSPDGSRIAFIRSSTNQIMMINPDGSGQQQVRDNSVVYHALVGWADGTHLLITEPGPEGVYIQSLNLADGSTRNLFTIGSNKADTVLSQDGQWIAFTNSLGGMQGNGLYISRLDGSERRLVAALSGLALYFPVWSPDSRWMILNLPDSSDPVDQMTQALLELETCQVIPLPEIGGEVISWGR